jgi:threonine dehydratase
VIGPEDIKTSYERIRPHLRRTPVLEVEAGTLGAGPVGLKLEHTQHTGSFKVRGAFNSILASAPGPAGVVAISGGNHGAAVAYAATQLGTRSKVFAPAYAGQVKIDRMRHFGAEVILMDKPIDEVIEAFEAFAAETGALAIHPYDAPLTMAGQGTLGIEIEQQLPDIDTLVVSVGGGGLIGGIATWYGDRIKILAVETEGTAAYAAMLRDGPAATILPSGISASALGAASIGSLPRAALAKADVQSIVVSDAEVTAAQSRLWDKVRLVGEPGAATALAAITSGAYRPAADEKIGVLVCGGNAGPSWFLD